MLAVSAWCQVINDLLDPTGQNLRVREDAQVSYFIIVLFIILDSFFLYLSVSDESVTLFSIVFQYMNTDISNHLEMWRVCVMYEL